MLVTDGPAPVGIHTASYEGSVPAPVVEVVDTIGAGDAFVAGFLTWWTAHALMQHDAASPDALLSATTAAIAVAAANCTVRGATLPTGFRWSERVAAPPGIARGNAKPVPRRGRVPPARGYKPTRQLSAIHPTPWLAT